MKHSMLRLMSTTKKKMDVNMRSYLARYNSRFAQNEDISRHVAHNIDRVVCLKSREKKWRKNNQSRSKLNVGQYQVISIKRLWTGTQNTFRSNISLWIHFSSSFAEQMPNSIPSFTLNGAMCAGFAPFLGGIMDIIMLWSFTFNRQTLNTTTNWMLTLHKS